MVTVDVTTICLNRKNDPHEKFQFMFLAASLRAGLSVLLSGCNTAAEWPGCSRGGSAVENAAKKNKANDAEIHPSPRFAVLMDRENVDTDAIIPNSSNRSANYLVSTCLMLYVTWTLFPGQDPQAATQP
jgi:hypothetical protein